MDIGRFTFPHNMEMSKAFVLGIREFRYDMTTGFDTGDDDRDAALYDAYDTGRELAHIATFRRYDY